MGTGTNKTMVLVCPGCKCSTTVKKTCIGVVCAHCKQYYSANKSLPEDQAVMSSDRTNAVDEKYVKFRMDAEKKAYDWRDKQMQKRKVGDILHHEPRDSDGKYQKKDWGKDKEF